MIVPAFAWCSSTRLLRREGSYGGREVQSDQPGLHSDPGLPPSAAHLNPHQLGQLSLGCLEDAAGLAALVGPEGAVATAGRLVLTVTVLTGACWLLPGLLGWGLGDAGPVTRAVSF